MIGTYFTRGLVPCTPLGAAGPEPPHNASGADPQLVCDFKIGSEIVFAYAAAAALSLCLWAASPALCEEMKRYDIPLAGSPSIGPEDAAVTIVEFLDYQ